MIKKISIIFLIASSSIQSSYASNDCAFDENYYNQSYYSNKKNIKHFSWNIKNKTAKIETDNGELISIKHWSCNHIGLHAVMLVGPYSDDNFAKIKKYFIKLASVTLEKNEFDLVLNQLNKKNVTLKMDSESFNIQDSQFSEFYFKYTVVGESLIIEIKFYKD